MLVIYHELLLKSIYKSREDSSTSLCMQYDKIKAFGNCNKYWNCSPVKIKHQTILFHYLCWDEDISSQKTDKWQLHGRVSQQQLSDWDWSPEMVFGASRMQLLDIGSGLLTVTVDIGDPWDHQGTWFPWVGKPCWFWYCLGGLRSSPVRLVCLPLIGLSRTRWEAGGDRTTMAG